MRTPRDEEGFTLVEVLVTMTLFGVLAVGFYQVLFSGQAGSTTTRSVVKISQEARLGFNRMIRDTREADSFRCAPPTYPCPTSTSYNVVVDFDGNGQYQNPPANTQGFYEDLVFAYDAAGKRITINGETLIAGVEPIPGQEIFVYSSHRLEFDWNADGITTWQELDDAPNHGIVGVGNNNRATTSGPDVGELSHISYVTYSFRVGSGTRTSDFYARSQLRNRR